MRTPPVQLGSIVTVTPETLVAGGDALARIDGFPIFIAGAYPGDRVRVRISELKKGFSRGSVEELLEDSPLRRAEPCPVASECGGCDWTSLRLDAQLDAKRAILSDTLKRIGKIDPAELPDIRVHPSPLNYRLRSRLQFDAESGAVGFFASRSHEVVPLPPECEVVGIETVAHLADIQQFAQREQGAVSIFESENAVVARIEGRPGQEETIGVGDDRYVVRTDGFFQVNRHLLQTLLRLVSEHASRVESRRVAFDLYGGVGFFSVPLSRLFDETILVESAAVSIAAARKNAQRFPRIRIAQKTVSDFLRRVDGEPDFIMIDPPRAGMEPGVAEALARFHRASICYLSCDPVTFSRDVARLRRLGWRLASLDLIDLFPNTHHIETLSRLEFAP